MAVEQTSLRQFELTGLFSSKIILKKFRKILNLKFYDPMTPEILLATQ